MIDDGLKYLFSVLKMLIRNALKGEIWAIFILGTIVFIFLVLISLKFLRNIFNKGLSTGYPFEEAVSEDDSGNIIWKRPLNGKRILLVLFLLIILILIYFSN